MEEVYESIFSEGEMPVVYATFWQRLGALIIDGLILSVIIFPLSYYNEITWKSIIFLLAITILTVAYKPFCEYRYGATIGKMALRIGVINTAYQLPSLQQALLRDIFQIIFSVVSLFITILMFCNPQFAGATTLSAVATLRSRIASTSLFTFILGIVYLADGICLLTDAQRRSLHDRMGATYVIKK